MSWWRRLFSRARLETELDAELRDHVERHAADLVRQGRRPIDARRIALASLGGIEPTKEYCRDARGMRPLGRLLLDCRYAVRRLSSEPRFTASVMLTVALGIASTTALLAVLNSVVLRPLPYRDSQRLAIVWTADRAATPHDGPVSWPDLEDWRRAAHGFDAFAAFRNRAAFVTQRDGDLVVEAHEATADFLPLLGVPPMLGRLWSMRDVAEGREDVVVVSHTVWRDVFGGDPRIIGKTISINHAPYEVIGVMPVGFRSPSVVGAATVGLSPARALWSPFVPRPRQLLRGNRGLRVIGHIQPTSTIAAAQDDLDGVAAALERAYPDSNRGKGVRVVALSQAISGQTGPAIVLLTAAAVLVLLLSCSNSAALVLVRATARSHEFAIRSAIGASRGRIAALLIAEGLCLASVGALAGIALATFLLGTVPQESFVADLGVFARLGVDVRTLGLAAGLTAIVGLALGLAPLIELSVVNLPLQGRGNRTTSDRRVTRTRQALVGAQVAVAVVLASGALLLLASFWRAATMQDFREPDRTVAFQTTVSGTGWSEPSRIGQLYDVLLQRLRGMPGAQSVGLTTELWQLGDASASDVVVDGRVSVPVSERAIANYTLADAEFIHMSGRLVKQGRLFDEDDGTSGRRAAVVNEAFVRAALSDGPVVGRFVTLSGLGNEPLEIVGVVSDATSPDPASPDRPRLFFNAAVAPASRFIVLVRFAAGELPTSSGLRAVVRAVDPALPVLDPRTVQAISDRMTAPRRWSGVLVVTFATVALMLASIGLYGTVSYEIARRRRECGIRLALGAPPAAIAALAARAGLIPVAGGVVVGTVGSVFAERLLRGFLYGTDASSWLVTVIGELALLAVATGVCLLAAADAAHVDAAHVLREQ